MPTEILQLLGTIIGILISITAIILNVLTLKKMRMEMKRLLQEEGRRKEIVGEATLTEIIQYGSRISAHLESRAKGGREIREGFSFIARSIVSSFFPDFGRLHIPRDALFPETLLKRIRRAYFGRAALYVLIITVTIAFFSLHWLPGAADPIFGGWVKFAVFGAGLIGLTWFVSKIVGWIYRVSPNNG